MTTSSRAVASSLIVRALAIVTISIPQALNTASNPVADLESRSRIRRVDLRPASARSAVSSGAGWVARAAAGKRVAPGRWTWGVPCLVTSAADSRVRDSVQSMGKKPAARIAAACARGKVRQRLSRAGGAVSRVGAGSCGWCRRRSGGRGGAAHLGSGPRPGLGCPGPA